MTDHLSNIELYYTPPQNISNNKIIIEGEEYSHIIRVMRHSINDEIYVTDGEAIIYSGKINIINKNNLELSIEKKIIYENKLKNVHFCIPKLKNNDRLEFALEKCTELGITNFFMFESERTISKGSKIDRWKKIVLSAMKQSLNSFLPKIEEISFEEIFKKEGYKIGLEQNTNTRIDQVKINLQEKYYFIFGPEGGLSENELSFFNKEGLYKITDNRLRTETSIVACASLINLRLLRNNI